MRDFIEKLLCIGYVLADFFGSVSGSWMITRD